MKYSKILENYINVFEKICHRKYLTYLYANANVILQIDITRLTVNFFLNLDKSIIKYSIFSCNQSYGQFRYKLYCIIDAL